MKLFHIKHLNAKLSVVLIVQVILFSRCESFEISKQMLVYTDTIIDITHDKVLIGGRIIDFGEGISKYGHCWSTESNPTVNAYKTIYENNNSYGLFISKMDSLELETKYYVRAYISNETNVVYGDIISFNTDLYGALAVETDENINVTTNNVDVFGYISDIGKGVINYGHCWSKDSIPTISSSKTNFGATDSIVFFSSKLSGLEYEEEYFVRAYATGVESTAYGRAINISIGKNPIPIVKTYELEMSDNTRHNFKVVITNWDNISPILQKGLCIDTLPFPTIANIAEITIGVGATEYYFRDRKQKTYFIRPFASNVFGIGYGDVIEIPSIDN